MISAIGVSYLLQNLVLYITGGLNQYYPTIPWISRVRHHLARPPPRW